MQTNKEKLLLAKLSQDLGIPVDEKLLNAVKQHHEMQNSIRQSIRQNLFADLSLAAAAVQNDDKEEIVERKVIPYGDIPTADELESLLKEEASSVSEPAPVIEKVAEPETLVERTAKFIQKEAVQERDSFQQPNPPVVDPQVSDILKKLKFLEQAIGKIAVTGPGGGAGDVINLTFPVKSVTSTTYTVTRHDYYVGVNVAARATITLPTAVGFPGRKVVIKDESGRCSVFPITVVGTIDNDPNGFILQINNGGVQMIYRDGWRII